MTSMASRRLFLRGMPRLSASTVATRTGSSPRVAGAILRFKHAGKMGHHRETLEEMAHRPEREAAEVRRQKKKDRKASKKKGKKAVSQEAAASDEHEDDPDEDDQNNFLSHSSPDSDEEIDWGDDDGDDHDNEDPDAEPTLPDPDEVKDKMNALLAKFEDSLKSVRGAEPAPEMFEDIQVNAYGSPTPLKAVGQVVIASSTMAQVTCFDPAVAKEVQKAIQLAMNLNPQMEEGGQLRIPLPRMSLETRQQTAKQLNKRAEACRQRIRKIRRKAMDVVKKGKDGKLSGISKDDAFANAKDIDGVTDEVMNNLKNLVDNKVASIMAV